MSSMRILLFGLFPFVAAAALLFGEIRKSPVETTDWRDLTVSGRGYIHTVDEQYENSIWLRSLKLGINQSGQLCCQLAGELRPLEPVIIIPSDWTKIDIAKDGTVSINTPGCSGIRVGAISLAMFLGDVNAESVGEDDVEERFGPPSECQPGSDRAGCLDQYTKRQFCIPMTWRSVLSTIIMGCASCGILLSQYKGAAYRINAGTNRPLDKGNQNQ